MGGFKPSAVIEMQDLVSDLGFNLLHSLMSCLALGKMINPSQPDVFIYKMQMINSTLQSCSSK